MRLKGFLIVLILFVFVGCNEIQRPKKPDNFIKEDLMVDVLYDISLMRTLRTYNMNEMRSLGIVPDSLIYKKYNIDSLQFAESINYYSVNFNDYAALWEEVNKRLIAQRDKLQFNQNDEDSIRNAAEKIKGDSINRQAKSKDSLLMLEEAQDSILAPIGN
ncbi:DUF4296 domain-containing protein [Leeuwenhoekiella aequorea]|uniref:DUF4296 domain-containing protein n=1 Tax=Leeuwenhoekiella aequorea TaxID=283736 RepID=A0A4Q0P5W3_9FLAO|nr:DUF4296 domain-containing protein [Leeuwenhoekiella aequorea]RXG22027.1 putative protein DUF4296 [Leeuwenhoekiella aequorea]